jgi:hypothetical protein
MTNDGEVCHLQINADIVSAEIRQALIARFPVRLFVPRLKYYSKTEMAREANYTT